MTVINLNNALDAHLKGKCNYVLFLGLGLRTDRHETVMPKRTFPSLRLDCINVGAVMKDIGHCDYYCCYYRYNTKGNTAAW